MGGRDIQNGPCVPRYGAAPPLFTARLCFRQEQAKKWVIEFVETATDAQKQGLFRQAAEIFPFILSAHFSWANLKRATKIPAEKSRLTSKWQSLDTVGSALTGRHQPAAR